MFRAKPETAAAAVFNSTEEGQMVVKNVAAASITAAPAANVKGSKDDSVDKEEDEDDETNAIGLSMAE